MQNKEKQYRSFIFTHIPKCGGTSFREYINTAALASNIKKEAIYIPGFNGLAHDKNIGQLNEKELIELQKKKLRVIANHAEFGVEKTYKLKIKQPFIYTILREPVSRFISHYNFFYFKNGYKNCKGVSLNDLPDDQLHHLVNMLSNIQVKYLSNVKHIKIVGLENMTKIAKYNLMFCYDDFGILENMSEALNSLREKTSGWLELSHTFPEQNKNKTKPKTEVSQRVVKLIEKYNRFDIELYNFAKELKQSTVQQISTID